MDWLQISVETNQPQCVEDCLLETGAVAVTLKDAADQPLLEPAPGETPLWDAVVVTGLYESRQDSRLVIAALQQALGLDAPPRHTTHLLEDRDWVRAWMERYEPLKVGSRLWICPHHHEVQEQDAVVVKLDPGLAFGTGTHASTALCLQWLEKVSLKGKVVVDYGCGSGILAIAAALLGARKVLAIDIDPQAIAATANNAERNQVQSILTAVPPGGLQKELDKLNNCTADVIVANILAGPLMELAPALMGLLPAGGSIALAGLLNTQATEVGNAYQQWIEWEQILSRDGWSLLTGSRIHSQIDSQ